MATTITIQSGIAISNAGIGISSSSSNQVETPDDSGPYYSTIQTIGLSRESVNVGEVDSETMIIYLKNIGTGTIVLSGYEEGGEVDTQVLTLYPGDISLFRWMNTLLLSAVSSPGSSDLQVIAAASI